MDVTVRPARGPVGGIRAVPASKSLHQRALLLAALGGGTTRLVTSEGAIGDDARHLAAALEAFGPYADGALGKSRERLHVDLGLGATGFRFAVAAATLRPDGARTLVRGRPELLARPHVPLRRALRRLGGHVRNRRSGAIRVVGGGIQGGTLAIRADVSSQFASALMLVAPRIGGLELLLLERPVSRPYLQLTLDVLGAFGIQASAEGWDEPGGRIRVAAGAPTAEEFAVEADASCAAPWWAAAALTGGRVEIPGLPGATHQADAALLPLLERMGCRTTTSPAGDVVVEGPTRLQGAGEVHLTDAPDLLPVVGVLAAAADGSTRVVGAGHARFKESDRLATVAAGIVALGGTAHVEGTELHVEGGGLSGGEVDVAGDHRIALAFGVLGLTVEGVVLHGAEAVSKSYPSFLQELELAAERS